MRCARDVVARRMILGVLGAGVAGVSGGTPPAPDALTESGGAVWEAWALQSTATATYTIARKAAGESSLLFDTAGAFATRLTGPASRDADWDFTGVEMIDFRMYAENSSPFGFQNSSPWVFLHTAGGGRVEFRPNAELLTSAIGQWWPYGIPMDGDNTWDRRDFGNVDLSSVTSIEFHADTWDSGFKYWLDDLRFDRQAPPPPPPPPSAYSVTPVLFVPEPSSFPAGYRPTPAQLEEDAENIRDAMRRMKTWYAEALGLTTSLKINELVVMEANGGISAYDIAWPRPQDRYSDGIVLGNTWGKVLGEVRSRGFTPGTSSEPRLVLIFCKGAGGFAGGAQWHSSTGGGMAMLGDWCLDSFAGRVPENLSWWSGQRRQFGATTHELGHAVGLPHPDIFNPVTNNRDYPYTVMGAWWDWPTYPVNPGDPGWTLRGLHGWSANAETSIINDYMDEFLLNHRRSWFDHEFCYTDLNLDGLESGPDVIIYLNRLNFDDPRADFSGDGVHDFTDFAHFVGQFDGCVDTVAVAATAVGEHSLGEERYLGLTIPDMVDCPVSHGSCAHRCGSGD